MRLPWSPPPGGEGHDDPDEDRPGDQYKVGYLHRAELDCPIALVGRGLGFGWPDECEPGVSHRQHNDLDDHRRRESAHSSQIRKWRRWRIQAHQREIGTI